MKTKPITPLVIAVTALALHLGAAAPGNESWIIGEGACAKCILKERGVKECQLTITTDVGGKRLTYYVVNNHVAKKFGKPVCKNRARLSVTGELKIVNGVRELTPSKIELVEEPEGPRIPDFQ